VLYYEGVYVTKRGDNISTDREGSKLPEPEPEETGRVSGFTGSAGN